MSREEQSSVKDVGGFVGGCLENGRRRKSNVLSRSLITLDADFADSQFWDKFVAAYPGTAAICYSTHKHTPEKPRLRLLIPLDREVSPPEYEPISRRVAERIGIEFFDHTTHDLNRLFYWPSASRDGEFYYRDNEGKPINADGILATYRNPQDVSEWPMSSREGDAVAHEIRKAGDPTEKPGLIGAFCRAYTIEEAIEKFLPEVYTAAGGHRYTYAKGSTSGGAVCYEDKFLFSHHDSDAATGKLCNAFDLVRIHKFKQLDIAANSDAPINKLPSYIAMQDLTRTDEKVKIELAKCDFGNIDLDDNSAWQEVLTYDRKGRVENTFNNICVIIEHDDAIKTRYNLFTGEDIAEGAYFERSNVAVNDEILGKMTRYIEKTYSIKVPIKKVNDVLTTTRSARGFDPVKTFITGTEWDGVERVDSLLINYLGASDSPEIREVTGKWVTAAVKRVFEPGCTFQNVLTLVGRQGTGKSTFFKTLVPDPVYFTDSVNVSAFDRERRESTTGKWIVELSEIVGLRRTDWESLKSYIGRNYDRGRAAYGVRVENTPRRFVFGATTNDVNFLRDADRGNRRWWVVDCPGVSRDWRNELVEIVPQIWSEAYQRYRNGESVEISERTRLYMEALQWEHSEDVDDPLPGMIDEYLATLLPPDWDTRNQRQKRAYYTDRDPLEAVGTIRRDEFCAQAFLTEWPTVNKKVTPQEVNRCMKVRPDWRACRRRFNGYGVQRGFDRVHDLPGDDDL